MGAMSVCSSEADEAFVNGVAKNRVWCVCKRWVDGSFPIGSYNRQRHQPLRGNSVRHPTAEEVKAAIREGKLRAWRQVFWLVLAGIVAGIFTR